MTARLTRRGERLATWVLVPVITVSAFYLFATLMWMVV